MLFDVEKDRVPDGVHFEKQLGDERIVDDSLDKLLSTLICDNIVAKIDGSDLLVRLK